MTTRHFSEDLGDVTHDILTNTTGGNYLSHWDEHVIPSDNVFVMGDNRDHSEDSRRWGFVRFDQIKGKAHFVWFSWDGCNGNPGQIRTSRFIHGLYK